MQLDQNVGQYHLTSNDIVITKVISYESLAVQTPWGAKQSSMNDEVLQIARQKPEENI